MLAIPLQERATLSRLLDDLGPGIIELLSAPRGMDGSVGEPVLYDRCLPSAIEPGDLILAVGMTAGSPEAEALLDRADRHHAAAIAFRFAEQPSPTFLRSPVAILAVPPTVAWGHLYGLLRTFVAGAAPTTSTAGTIPLGDLFGLANAVADMVGGPVTIEDVQNRVLAYSTHDHPVDPGRHETILGRKVPDEWANRLSEAGFFKKLWASPNVVRIENLAAELRPRLAVAVRAGTENLGSIWVAEGEVPLGPEAEGALREAARIAALHLIRRRSSDELERRQRGDLVLSLFEGRGQSGALSAQLGIDPHASFTVLAFELQIEEEAEVALLRERALDLITIYCEAFRRRAACVAVGRVIYTLLPTPEDEELAALADDIAQRALSTLHQPLHVGIGSTVDSLGGVAWSRAEADRVLRVLASTPDGPSTASIEDVRAATILHELADLAGERPHLRRGALSALSDHDRDNNTSYVATLRAFLQAFGDIPEAARLLGIHSNTCRYRMKRLAELSGLNLSDPDQRLVVDLQLRWTPATAVEQRASRVVNNASRVNPMGCARPD